MLKKILTKLHKKSENITRKNKIHDRDLKTLYFSCCLIEHFVVSVLWFCFTRSKAFFFWKKKFNCHHNFMKKVNEVHTSTIPNNLTVTTTRLIRKISLDYSTRNHLVQFLWLFSLLNSIKLNDKWKWKQKISFSSSPATVFSFIMYFNGFN